MKGKTKPDGGLMFPGKTCRDLQLCHPNIESGEYFIDPNFGSTMDKFEVDCNFDNGKAETCIRPKQRLFKAKMDSVATWRYLVSDLKSEEISYDADEIALRFLRLNSAFARQNITYKCFNQHAHRDSNGDESRYIMIKSADGAEIDTNKDRRPMFLEVLRDECNRKDGKWHSAVFELSTKKMNSLPISDVRILHQDMANDFEIEMGPICFS